MDKLLLTPEEAAHQLSISRSKVYQLMATGELDSVRIGGSRRVSFDALQRFIAGLEGERAS
ncbi:MAG: helix-turn-helix domain-containing protein [Acidimicrobiales bacterium]